MAKELEENSTVPFGSSSDAAKHALVELLAVRKTLLANIDRLKGSKVAVRRLKRAHRAIGRQTLNLASDLIEMGVSTKEIADLVNGTTRTTPIRVVAA